MALFPGATWKPITANKGRKALTVYNRVNLHVAVSEAASLHGYFNRPGIPDSHFYVRKDGSIEQYVDTEWRAFADLDGNDATISIETQGGLTNSNAEPWTDSQVDAIARIYAWAVKTHGIANKIATSSRPNIESRGLSWHRLGIDGNFPALPSILAGRNQRGGGMHYSKSRGKGCPGDTKIEQVTTIFRIAQDYLSDKPAPPAPKPEPAPTPPKPQPTPAKKYEEDGFWGTGTTKGLQAFYGTPQDGVISSQEVAWKNSNPGLTFGWEWVSKPKGSQLIYAMQQDLKKRGFYSGKLDGIAGPQFFTAMQRALGTIPDGKVSKESRMVYRLQQNLNAGKVF